MANCSIGLPVIVFLLVVSYTIQFSSIYLKLNRNILKSSSLLNYRIQPRSYTLASNTNIVEIKTSQSADLSRSSTSDVPFEKPPKDKLSKLQKEFDSMVNDFTHFSEYDIACIENDKYRALFEGVATGVKEPAVYNAFLVLYEDYIPVRLAGRMIYRHLKSVMTKSREAIAMETQLIIKRTGLTTNDIDVGRLAFLAAKDGSNDSMDKGELTMQQLVNSGIVYTIMEILGYDSFDAFLSDMDHDRSGALTFEKFMTGLQNCAQNVCEDSCNVSTVLLDLNDRMDPLERRRKLVPLDQRKRKYSDRYDNMIVFFKDLEHLLLPNTTTKTTTDETKKVLSRIEIVLQGCIVGAQNKGIVNALRVLYVDYSALRIAGDLIFKLVSILVKKRSIIGRLY